MSVNISTVQPAFEFCSSELSTQLSCLPVAIFSNHTLSFQRPTSDYSLTCVPLYSHSLDWTKLSYDSFSLYRLSTAHTENTAPLLLRAILLGFTRDCSLPTPLVTGYYLVTESTLFIVACAYFGYGLEMVVLLFLHASQSQDVYWAVAYKSFEQIRHKTVKSLNSVAILSKMWFSG
jgi:hypothetical protein